MCHFQIYSLKLAVGADALCVIVAACRHIECARRGPVTSSDGLLNIRHRCVLSVLRILKG